MAEAFLGKGHQALVLTAGGMDAQMRVLNTALQAGAGRVAEPMRHPEIDDGERGR